MPSEAKNGGSASNDATVGTEAWVNTSNATGAANASSASVTLAAGQSTQYLKVTNFGFGLPVDVSVDGVVVVVRKSGAIGKDLSVRLVKGASIVGDDKATATAWPGALTDVSYGGASDGWTASLNESDVNASTFGIVIAAQYNAFDMNPTVQIDSVTITVHYSTAAEGSESVSMRSQLAISQP